MHGSLAPIVNVGYVLDTPIRHFTSKDNKAIKYLKRDKSAKFRIHCCDDFLETWWMALSSFCLKKNIEKF